MEIDRNVDLSYLLGRKGAVLGHIEPVDHARVKEIYVVLHQPGPLSDEHMTHVAQMAQAAAQAAAANRG